MRMTALAALETVLRDFRHHGVGLIFSGTSSRVRLQLRRAGIHRHNHQLAYVHDLDQARGKALRWLEEKEQAAGTTTAPAQGAVGGGGA
ncbi:hypothetical protein D3C81_2000820 [compost metagenome]